MNVKDETCLHGDTVSQLLFRQGCKKYRNHCSFYARSLAGTVLFLYFNDTYGQRH